MFLVIDLTLLAVYIFFLFQVIFYLLTSLVFFIWLNTTAFDYVTSNKIYFVFFRAFLNTFIFGMWSCYALFPLFYLPWYLLQVLNIICLIYNASISYIFSHWKHKYDAILTILAMIASISFTVVNSNLYNIIQVTTHFLLTIFAFVQLFIEGAADHDVQIIVDRKSITVRLDEQMKPIGTVTSDDINVINRIEDSKLGPSTSTTTTATSYESTEIEIKPTVPSNEFKGETAERENTIATVVTGDLGHSSVYVSRA